MRKANVRKHLRRTKKGKVQVRQHSRKVYQKWRKLVNMTPAELKAFKATEEGKKAGLSKQQAKELGIKSGQESAEWILRMKPKAKTFEQAEKNWTEKEWEWAKRQNSFNARMLGNKGPLYDEKGRMTRKHTSLLIWGHNPKKNRGAGILSKKIDNMKIPEAPDGQLAGIKVPIIQVLDEDKGKLQSVDMIVPFGTKKQTNEAYKEMMAHVYGLPKEWRSASFKNFYTEGAKRRIAKRVLKGELDKKELTPEKVSEEIDKEVKGVRERYLNKLKKRREREWADYYEEKYKR